MDSKVHNPKRRNEIVKSQPMKAVKTFLGDEIKNRKRDRKGRKTHKIKIAVKDKNLSIALGLLYFRQARKAKAVRRPKLRAKSGFQISLRLERITDNSKYTEAELNLKEY